MTQAEAIIDIINAKTQQALKIGNSQLSGNLRKITSKIKNDVLDIVTQIEAEIEFFDDTGETFSLLSAGTVPLSNIAISFKVWAGLFAVFAALVLLRTDSDSR